MKKSFLTIGLAVGVSIFMPAKLHSQSCPNLNFSMGNFTNWQAYTGTCLNGNDTIIPCSPIAGRHTIIVDAMIGFSIQDEHCPAIPKVSSGFMYAAKLGNDSAGAKISGLEYTMTVDSNNSLLIVHFAWVMQKDTGHNLNEQPQFNLQIRDSLGQPLNIPCGDINFIAQDSMQNLTCDTNNIVAFTWTIVGFSLESLIGQTIKIYFETRDCVLGCHFGYAYIVAECRPMRIELHHCTGQIVERIQGTVGFIGYKWTRSSDTSWIIEGNETAARQIVAPPYLIDGEIITCELTSALGCKSEVKVAIKTTYIDADFVYGIKDANGYVPIIENNLENWYDSCNRTATFVDFSKVYNSKKDGILWEIINTTNGVIASSTDSLFTFTFPDPDFTPIKYRIRLTVYTENLCADTSSQYITIYPSPKVQINGENQLCGGDSAWLKATTIRSEFINHQWSWIDTDGNPQTETGDSILIYNQGTYTLVSQDSVGCFSRDTLIVTTPKATFTALDITHVNCYGEATGSFIHGAISGGQPPYTLAWTLFDKDGNDSVVNAQNSNFGIYTNLKADIYRFNATDIKGCILFGEVEVKQNDSLKITAEQYPATAGLSDGKLNLTATGGMPPYKFNVKNENGAPVNPEYLGAGAYKITVTDAVKCETSDTISVLEKTVGISEINNGKPSLVIYPNPTNGKLKIDNKELKIKSIEIFNTIGQPLLSIPSPSSPEIEINISHLPAGMYFLKINNKVIKIIKQ